MLQDNLAELGHFLVENAINFYLDNLDWSWALSLIWLLVDSNIAQKVALCIITLSAFLPIFMTLRAGVGEIRLRM